MIHHVTKRWSWEWYSDTWAWQWWHRITLHPALAAWIVFDVWRLDCGPLCVRYRRPHAPGRTP